jgi:hypothetical protein
MAFETKGTAEIIETGTNTLQRIAKGPILKFSIIRCIEAPRAGQSANKPVWARLLTVI